MADTNLLYSEPSTGVEVSTDQLETGEYVQNMKIMDGTVGGGNRAVVSSSGALSVNSAPDTYLALATDVSASGNATVHTPASGKAVRLHYMCLSADAANTAAVTVVVQFASGTPIYKLSLMAGAIWARNVGAGRRYLQGVANDALIVNLSVNQIVHVSVEYEEL